MGEEYMVFLMNYVHFWWMTEKIGEFQLVTLKFSFFSGIKSNSRYIFQLLEELKVTGRYIFQMFRPLQVMGHFFFQLLKHYK